MPLSQDMESHAWSAESNAANPQPRTAMQHILWSFAAWAISGEYLTKGGSVYVEGVILWNRGSCVACVASCVMTNHYSNVSMHQSAAYLHVSCLHLQSLLQSSQQSSQHKSSSMVSFQWKFRTLNRTAYNAELKPVCQAEFLRLLQVDGEIKILLASAGKHHNVHCTSAARAHRSPCKCSQDTRAGGTHSDLQVFACCSWATKSLSWKGLARQMLCTRPLIDDKVSF